MLVPGGTPLSGDALHERRELIVVDRHDPVRGRICPACNIRCEFVESGDTLGLQAVIFGAEIAVGPGMARLVPARVTQHIVREEVLRVRARSGTTSSSAPKAPAAASTGVSTNSMDSWRLPFRARMSAPVGLATIRYPAV